MPLDVRFIFSAFPVQHFIMNMIGQKLQTYDDVKFRHTYDGNKIKREYDFLCIFLYLSILGAVNGTREHYRIL